MSGLTKSDERIRPSHPFFCFEAFNQYREISLKKRGSQKQASGIKSYDHGPAESKYYAAGNSERLGEKF